MVIKRWRLDFHREFGEADMDLIFPLFFPIINSSVFIKDNGRSMNEREKIKRWGRAKKPSKKTSK